MERLPQILRRPFRAGASVIARAQGSIRLWRIPPWAEILRPFRPSHELRIGGQLSLFRLPIRKRAIDVKTAQLARSPVAENYLTRAGSL